MGRVDHIWRGKTRLERWCEKVHGDPDGCWLWLAPAMKDGYGQFGVGDRPVRAHHFLLAVPEGYVWHHLCHEPLCVRPDHLELLTRSDHSTLHAADHKCTHGDQRRNARGNCLECDRRRSQRRRQDPVYRAKETEWKRQYRSRRNV